MDDPSLLPFLNNNGNGHHYSIDIDEDIEHEEDELDDEDENDLQDQQYPEDEIDEDEIEEDDIDDDDEQEILIPPPSSQQQQTIQSERGGRRKGVPRRLQLSPQIIKGPVAPQRLLPLSLSKSSSSVHHHDQPILTSDQEDEDLTNENQIDIYYHENNREENCIELDLLSQHLIDNHNENDYDENNNTNYNDDENIFEIVDDILADIVTIIVRDIRQQRQKNIQQRIINNQTNGYKNQQQQTNGLIKTKQKITNGKDLIQTNSIKSSKSQSLSSTKVSDSSTLFNEFTKMMHLNSQQQLVKHKHSPSSSSSFTSPPSAKRQKTSEILSSSQSNTSLSLQQHQLLWQMTQQLMMSTQSNETDTSSLLKQQLLGLTPPGTIPKRVGRPPKQQIQPPQVMRSSTNMIPPTSHSSTNTSPFERGNFAPRRRGRPPKYVTERASIPGLPSHDLDPSPYDQLFAAIENSVTGNSNRTSSAAFQSALASMLGHQPGLSIPPPPPSIPPPVVRNGTPASMVKQSAGQTRHSLPASSTASKLSHGIGGGGGNGFDIPLMATKKRGPGRPPKSQTLLDSHQVLQATKRMNSSSSSLSTNTNTNTNNNNNNNFPSTMIPSSPTSFNLNAAFVEMLQQQQHPR